MFFDEHHSVSANAKPAVANGFYLIGGKSEVARAIIDHHEIIAGGLIFIKMDFQGF
jgi:hypothetical protein